MFLSALKGASTRAVCSLLLAVLLVTLAAHIALTATNHNRHWLASSAPFTWPRFLSGSSYSDLPADYLHAQRLYVENGQPVHKLAVVIPFIGVQTWKLLHSWTKTWTRYPACSALRSGLRAPFSATLFLYFDQALEGGQGEADGFYNSSLLRDTLLNTWNALPHSHCFSGGVQLIDMRRGDLNHIEGSCVMFYDLFQTLEAQHFQHFMWMEPDVLPVQRNWLERMTEEVADNAQCQRWWIKGSNPRCASWYGRIRDRRDYHFNGNALYCLGSDRFADFRQRVIDYYPGGTAAESPKAGGCATGAEYELGMDHAMYQYRLRPNTFEYSKSIMAKFVYADFMQNHCQEPYTPEQVARAEPSTFLVHSGTSFRHPSNVAVSQMFNAWFGREPSLEEKQKYSVRLDLGEIENEEQLVKSICVDNGWINHIQYERCRLVDRKTNTTISFDNKLPRAQQIANGLSLPWSQRWPGRYYLWTTDFHAGPMMCNAEVYRQLGIVAHAEVDFGNCIYHGVCKDRMEVLQYNDWHGFSLDPCPHKQRQLFYERYREDEEMARVDIVTCSHPASNCELFLPLNKSMIVLATTRIEFGRNDPEVGWRKPIMDKQSPATGDVRWREWVHNLRLIAASKRNVVAANSLYDKHYIEYFTGIQNVHFLPSLCKPADAPLLRYSPFRSQFLIGPSRDNLDLGPQCSEWQCVAELHPLYLGLQRALNATTARTGYPLQASRIRSLYQSFALQDVLNHRAVIVFPYQSSTMMLTELYRANVPMLAPSKRFLLQWELDHQFLFERVYGHPYALSETGERTEPHTERPDPNSRDEAALEHWVGLFDIYSWPHVALFDSWEHAAQLMLDTDFQAVHERMAEHNAGEERRIVQLWRDAIEGMEAPAPATAVVTQPQLDINAQLRGAHGDDKVWLLNEADCLNMDGPGAAGTRSLANKRQEAQLRLKTQLNANKPSFGLPTPSHGR